MARVIADFLADFLTNFMARLVASLMVIRGAVQPTKPRNFR